MKIPKIFVGLVLFMGLGFSTYLLTETQGVSAQTQKTDASFSGHDDVAPGNSQRVLKEESWRMAAHLLLGMLTAGPGVAQEEFPLMIHWRVASPALAA